MNKKYLIITAIVLVAVLIVGFAFTNKPAPTTTNTTKPIVNKTPTLTDQPLATPLPSTSNYILFNNNLEDFKDKKRLLFFYANWCPTCSSANTDITNNVSNIPNDLAIIRVNYNDTETDDTEKRLANKYGITYQHTFVLIDSNGNEVKKWNGGNFKDILEKLK